VDADFCDSFFFKTCLEEREVNHIGHRNILFLVGFSSGIFLGFLSLRYFSRVGQSGRKWSSELQLAGTHFCCCYWCSLELHLETLESFLEEIVELIEAVEELDAEREEEEDDEEDADESSSGCGVLDLVFGVI
jgi:hypothetical protein